MTAVTGARHHRRRTRTHNRERARRPKRSVLPTRTRPVGVPFVAMLAMVVVLNLIGLVMVLSASSVAALDEFGSSWYYFSRQLAWVAAGGVVLLVSLRIDYHAWARVARPLLAVAMGMLVLVLVPGFGVTVNGSTRWLGAGPVQIQPAEFAKLGLLVFVADLLTRRARHLRDSRVTLRPVLVVTGAAALLLLLQPNLGTTIVLVAIVGSVLLVSGVPLPSLFGWGTLGVTVAAWLSLSAGYRRARVLAFLDPWDDPLNTGWQTIQSLVGVTSGGLTGTGLGASRAKWGFLPFAHTDFIYAIIGEELGLLGTLAVVGLFVGIGIFGIRTALTAPDRFGMLLATGVTAWLLVQAFVNIGAVLGILPITGVPLPFVSFGGSSLLSTMAAAGLLLNVSLQSSTPRQR